MKIRISQLKKIVQETLRETFANGSRWQTAEGDEGPDTEREPDTSRDPEQLLLTMWDDDMDSNYGLGPDTERDEYASTERSPETKRSR